MSVIPFLRSPPFPWTDEQTAAVSAPGQTRIDDPDAVLDAIAGARVGGAFWRRGSANPWYGRGALPSSDMADDAAIAAFLADRTVLDANGDAVDPEALRAAAIRRLSAAAYRDPFTGETASPVDVVRLLAEWRRQLRSNRTIVSVVGMAQWKRGAMAQFLWDGERTPPFRTPAAAVEAGGTAAYWPSRVPRAFGTRIAERGGEAWAVEDGFLRSNGLGAECRPPFSVIVDPTGGIYFDPARPSLLERVLAEHPFDEVLLARARRLRRSIVATRLGKYGVDAPGPPIEDLPADRPVVLAVGQVEDDLSVLRGGAGITANAGFLARVRAEEPGAYILYRPHPDVAAGLRRGEIADPVAAGLADRVLAGGSLLDLIQRADAVHVLSSLTGFEALLRRRRVTVHGQPFYAGWGLTRDLVPAPERRRRRLSLDALVAGALILAPRYRDPVTLVPCPPEVLVRRLAAGVVEETIVTGFRRAVGATRRALRVAGAWR